MTDADLINERLDLEGGAYTDRASDKGGPTQWGITIPVLSEWRQRVCTADDIRTVTRDEAYQIVEHQFFRRSGYEKIADARVRALMVDWALNSSIERATRWLQRTVGVTIDGIFGMQTLLAANTMDSRVLLKKLGLARQVFYVRTALQDERIPDGVVTSTNLENLEGWLNRNWKVAVDPL
jgi:lysozyme family protein